MFRVVLGGVITEGESRRSIDNETRWILRDFFKKATFGKRARATKGLSAIHPNTATYLVLGHPRVHVSSRAVGTVVYHAVHVEVQVVDNRHRP